MMNENVTDYTSEGTTYSRFQPPPPDPGAEPLMLQLIVGLCGSFSALGNFLIVVAIAIGRHNMTTTYKLVANLALSDCVTGCSHLGVVAILTNRSIVQSDFLCSVMHASFLFCTSASVNALLLVTIDRYLIIVWPLSYQHVTSFPKFEIAMCLGWMLAIVFAILPVVNIFGRKTLIQICKLGNIFTKEYIIFIFCVTYVVPLALMLIMYIRIGIIAKKHKTLIASLQVTASPRVQGNSQQCSSSTIDAGSSTETLSSDNNTLIKHKARSKEQWKATKTIFIVLGYFVLSWLPFYVCMLIRTIQGTTPG